MPFESEFLRRPINGRLVLGLLFLGFFTALLWLMDSQPQTMHLVSKSLPVPQGIVTPPRNPPMMQTPLLLTFDLTPAQAHDDDPMMEMEPIRHTKALWFQRHQESNGSWSLSGFQNHCGFEGSEGICEGRGDSRYDVAGTGLMLLTCTSRGISPKTLDQRGLHKALKGSLEYLKSIQNSDGSFGQLQSNAIFNQSVATLALCEIYCIDNEASLRPYVEKAVAYLLSNRQLGSGWCCHAHHPASSVGDTDIDGINDAVINAWALLALKSAETCGIVVDPLVYKETSVWNAILRPTLSKSMRNHRATCCFGSWDPTPNDAWEQQYGGRISTTALGILSLNIYYIYPKELNKDLSSWEHHDKP